ncbi:MAG: sulfatase [Rhodothermales bacterium]|nr:sulfatase [Rhodothermales bacterium]
MNKRSSFLFHWSHLCLLGLVFSCAGCKGGSGLDSDSPPNIIFVFTDDHAAQAVGAYGGILAELNPTPNIDRLASEGILFRNAFVTNSICAPSRAVILTGKHSHINGVMTNRDRFDSSQVTFPKLLQGAGYQTAIVGKWHLKSEPTGFDYWEVLPGQGKYYNPDFRTADGVQRTQGYVTDVITDRAIDWIDSGRDPSRPFLLMYQHKAPHREWSPGPGHLTKFDDEVVPEPATLFDDYTGRASVVKEQEMEIDRHMDLYYDLKVRQAADSSSVLTKYADQNYDRMNDDQRRQWDSAYEPKNARFMDLDLSGDELVRWKYQRYVKDYLRTIASVDDNLGRLIEYLEAEGLAENTVLVYNSDQGFYLGEHGWFDKRWMYEESLRSPLIIRWPAQISKGLETRAMVQNLDFAPTFLDLAGVPIPEDIQGESFASLLRGEGDSPGRSDIYYQYYESDVEHRVAKHYGIRTDRYKLIHYYEVDEWELFDLATDADELRSVYDEPGYAATVADLGARLYGLRDDFGVVD